MHFGIDVATPIGTPARRRRRRCGDQHRAERRLRPLLRIRYDGTHETAYAHLSRCADHLERGARVRQGEVIGYVGSSGRSTGPHLHYEMLVDGRQVDPFAVGPSFAQSVKGGTIGTVRTVGKAFLNAGNAVARTAIDAVIEPVSGIVADLWRGD